MPEPRITALILARDEADNLPGCLASVAWAEERLVVVDAGSRDDTEAIARRLADRVLVRPFDDFASQRNAGLALATSNWIFAIDADERATPELASAIRRAVKSPTCAGYRIARRSVILGRRFSHSGTQHDRPLRLFRRDSGQWTGLVHEKVTVQGPVGRLDAWLDHRTLPDIATFLRKLDNYTTLEARRLRHDGHPYRLSDLTVRPFLSFVALYLVRQGFRDGLEGFAFCALSGLSVAVRHWKLRELTCAGGTP
jgi:(heptosyl)LPS beta-1,4-glucosyltransferase